jgi:putative tryptophan/tyrosine transport system substrate-binding protein
MKRRALLAASGAWLAAVATRSIAQATNAMRRIVLVHPGVQQAFQQDFDAFRASMQTYGYVEGKGTAYAALWAEGRTARLEQLAVEAAALRPAVILTASSAGVAACRKATSSIPIVFATAVNPVEQGFVASLQRPGGNVTGIVLHSGLWHKIIEVAREALPKVRRLAILTHDQDPIHKGSLEAFEQSAPRFKFEPLVVRISRAEDLDRAFSELAQRKAEALYLPNLALLASLDKQLVARALKARLPLISSNPSFAEAGGLFSYGTPREENWRRAAALVDKILRGAKPGDIAVEQPERIELTINLKTAKAIGVKLSATTMLRATKVIE